MSDETADPFAARQRADAFAKLFEAVHEGVFIGWVGPERCSTMAANHHLRRMLGLGAEAPDTAVQPFASDAFVDQVERQEFLRTLETQCLVTDHPVRLRRADGTSVWVEVTAQAEPRRAGPGLFVEALLRDVTERRRRDAHSRELSRHLAQAEKLAALGQTISGVAHELNNPLATILNWAERLTERPLDPVARRGTSVILAEAERAARIVRHLLTFARKRQSTRTLVELNALIADTLSRREGDERIRVETRFESELPAVFADGHQVEQVLLNLISNAEQAMIDAHGGGTLRIQTSADELRRHVVFEVADDGPGIPAEVRERIFDPFFTTKDVGKGTGLGLTVAYALVEEHGGRVTLDCPEGGGTVFTVALPTIEAGSAAPQSQAPVSPHRVDDPLTGVRVLLVEDEPALAAAVGESLTDAGLVVQHAPDGEVALALLRRQRYDVIVCDLKMPRVDGMMLYRAIASTTPALARRVIFVTGDVAGTDAERFLADTGSRWLAKPFRLADLLKAVRDTVA